VSPLSAPLHPRHQPDRTQPGKGHAAQTEIMERTVRGRRNHAANSRLFLHISPGKNVTNAGNVASMTIPRTNKPTNGQAAAKMSLSATSGAAPLNANIV